MHCKANETVTLPTANAPAGYTFLGWVTEEYNNVAEQPAVLTAAISIFNRIAPTVWFSLSSVFVIPFVSEIFRYAYDRTACRKSKRKHAKNIDN